MVLTDQRYDRSEQKVRERGFAALVESLGYADALRFLAQMNMGQGDYLKWQSQVLGDASVNELYEHAASYWETQQHESGHE